MNEYERNEGYERKMKKVKLAEKITPALEGETLELICEVALAIALKAWGETCAETGCCPMTRRRPLMRSCTNRSWTSLQDHERQLRHRQAENN